MSPDIAVSPHLINISSNTRATQRLLHVPGPFLLPDLTNRIYEVLPDAFDFLMFFSTNKIEQLPRLTASNFNAGVHASVQVNYTGTGLGLFDGSASYGSNGRLLGVNALDSFNRGIDSNNATHEITHQWAAFISQSLGLSEGAHYKGRSSVGSLVGGFRWIDNGDGTFTMDCDEGRNGAHHAPPLDKYMMGLTDGTAVAPLHVYDEAGPPPLFRCDQVIDDIVTTVTIEDIQGIHGVRSPGPADTRRDFAMAFVAESHERLLNPSEMTFYEILAEHYTKAIPPEDPDPYIEFNWASIARFFGEGTTWRSDLPVVVPTSTPTPTKQPDPGDTDGDGCSDAQENGPSEVLGGRRDYLYFWDFMDQWTGSPFQRDRAVTAGDIGAVVARFGTFHEPPLTKAEAAPEALTPPTDLTSYHPAADRSGSDPEGNPWDLLPPDGSISAGDIGAVVAQFGHSCSGLPLKPAPTPTPTLAATPTIAPTATAIPCPLFVPGELIVGLEPGTIPERVAEIVESVGATIIEFIFDLGSGPVYLVGVPVGQELNFIPFFEAFPEVRYAQPNYIICIEPPF